MPSAGRKSVIKNKPKSAKEISNDIVEPLISGTKPDVGNYKRGEDISLRDDELKNISIGFEQIDEAILYYFNNEIKPFVIENGTKVNIPVMYANPERWDSAQKNGEYRDKDGKIIFPIITIKRDNMERNRTLGNKLDGNEVHVYQSYTKKFSKKNMYDSFSVLTNRIPVQEIENIVVPDYYTLQYTCTVYTSFMSDLNRILEAISFKSDSYWGRPNKFNYKAKIDSYPIIQEIANGQDRRCMSTFSLMINGYIIPDNINKFLASKPKTLTKSQVVFTLETVDGGAMAFTSAPSAGKNEVQKQYVDAGGNVNIINIGGGGGGVSPEILTYLSTVKTINADVITSNTATFLNASILQPPVGSGLVAPSLDSFIFLVNGQTVTSNAVVSFAQVGSNLVWTVNSNLVGYTFDSSDEIVVNGKLVQ